MMQEQKEKPLNSDAKINYEKKYYELLEIMADLGLQLQVMAKNKKDELKKPLV